MTQSEFSLIDYYFKGRGIVREDVSLSIGDDAAVTEIPAGCELVTAVDTLVNGVHFPEHCQPYNIGYKALAVNLSDMAAMGAEPVWCTLALTMPEADETWLQQFCDGFFDLANQFNVQLVGGDTTQGPLTVTVQIMGLVPKGMAITRSGAAPGDKIFVSGTLGDAALGLHVYQNKNFLKDLDKQQKQTLLAKLNQPLPRVELGIALRQIASSAIDISDGLLADLNHVLNHSKLGATLHLDQIPVSGTLHSQANLLDSTSYALYGGDDYELCFTVPQARVSKLLSIITQLSVNVTEIGEVEWNPGIRLLNHGVIANLPVRGFEHFSQT
ncbi:thiamine-phosphate kinase [Kaarinaea lacus]